MILTLAIRNLFHDRMRLAVTLVGILFSIVLVAVQLGLFLGARKMIIAMIDHARGELWVTTFGAKSFEEGGVLLTPRERHAALATPGVSKVEPLVVAFAEWRKPGGGSTNCVIVGADREDGGLAPWSVVEGSVEALSAPDAVAVDRTYLVDLGIAGVGDTAQIESGRVKVRLLTSGIRSFTTAPYVFSTLERARMLLGVPGENSTFFLIEIAPGAEVEAVRRELSARLPNTEVLTKTEFRDRCLDQWLFSTGAGVALIGGAVLGLVVGTVIVAQTLYSSTKDHLIEFATLRALGSSSGYIHKVILAQAGLSAVIGYALGMVIALVIVSLSADTPLPIVMTPGLAVALFILTVLMCAISAISAIMKVMRIDPAMVFMR
ncbi:MAG TPA: ABC transporter permease [Hyphomicrobiaceae bacterium]|nr:ABC transporter permease [Hyphomicrobiaceae bacterium]